MLLCPLVSRAQQDIFDKTESIQYARHLYESGRYGWAAEEYGRLLRWRPASDTFQYMMLNCYRRDMNYTQGMQQGLQLYRQNHLHTARPSIELVKLMLLDDSTGMALWLLPRLDAIDTSGKTRLWFDGCMLNADWKAARSAYTLSIEDFDKREAFLYDSLLCRAEHLHNKNPLLAGMLSTVVPGLGKVYAGRWRDGVMAAAVIAAMGYTAYEGFHMRGTRSVLGWMFGGLTLGFYAGDIYGSIKAARLYLPWRDHQITTHAKDIIASGF